MGTSTSLAQVGQKVDRLQELAAGRGLRRVVERVALASTNDVRDQLRRDVPSGRLRGARNARVGARYDVKGVDNPVARIRMTGPVHLVANPAKRHLIIPKGLGTRGTASRVAGELGARSAFGGSGRGMFRGTRRTQIGTRRAIAEGRGRSAAQALTINGSLRGFAFHPGHRGKDTWGKAAHEVERHMSDRFATEVRRSIQEVFR